MEQSLLDVKRLFTCALLEILEKEESLVHYIVDLFNIIPCLYIRN